jgi:ParB family transcriptional regulator, chromosome partitioning protein
MVKELTKPKTETATKNGTADSQDLDANVRAAISELQSALGTKVRLIPRNNGGGKIEVEYYSQDDLDRIYSVIVKS